MIGHVRIGEFKSTRSVSIPFYTSDKKRKMSGASEQGILQLPFRKQTEIHESWLVDRDVLFENSICLCFRRKWNAWAGRHVRLSAPIRNEICRHVFVSYLYKMTGVDSDCARETKREKAGCYQAEMFRVLTKTCHNSKVEMNTDLSLSLGLP